MHSLGQISAGRPGLFLLVAVFTIAVSGVAIASGFPPFAFEDSATVKRGATVSVLDSGESSILANDFDFEGDSLTAELTKGPKRGELTLFEDGTFSYRHDGSANDNDRFEYRAFDGTGYSRDTKVTILIVPGEPIQPEIVDQRPVSTLEDQSVRIRLRDLVVVDPDSEYPRDFSLDVGDGENYTRVESEITPTGDFNGELTVPVRVNDGTSFSNIFSLRIDVVPQNDAPFVVAPIPDAEATEGDEFELSVAAAFGDIDVGDSLRFSASGLPASGTITLDAETGMLQGTPIRSDVRDQPYSVRITATDTANSSADQTFALLINPKDRAELAVFSSVTTNPTLVGEPTSWSVNIENRGPAQLENAELICSWTSSGRNLSLTAPTNCTTDSNGSSTPTLRCSLPPLTAGTVHSYTVEATQEGDGDITLISVVVADDPTTGNNTALVTAQVAIAFSEGPTQVLNQSVADLAVADFNSDGFPDLVTSGNDTSVYLNSGDRTLQTPGTAIGSGGSLLTLLDWNGDGVKDVAIAGPSAADAQVYLGDNNGSFVDSIQLSTGAQGEMRALAAADVDGDGISELVLAGTFGTVVARNLGTNRPRIDPLPGGAALDIGVADLNQDGFVDIVSVATVDRAVNLLQNLGDGSFVVANSIRQGSVARVTAADVDNDGDSDLLLATDGEDLNPPHIVAMYRQSNWDFVVADTLGASIARDLLPGDVNGDGQLDIVVVNEAGVHQVYMGDGGTQFTLDAEQIVSPGMGRGAVADFNADNSLDLILVGPEADFVELHANNGIGRLGPGDIIAPELTLNGGAEINVPSGAVYLDEGATAIDDIDGDLTGEIVVDGSVNTAIVGSYRITYTVSDRASNTSQISRTVIVGVNQGTGGGGGGGGTLSLLAFLLLGTIVLAARSRFGCQGSD